MLNFLQQRRVAIVGAGPSGLTAARQALQCGCQVRVFERERDIGGVWHMASNPEASRRPIPPFGSMFVSKEVCAFSELPIPEHFPTFMRPHDVLAYMALYAEKFGLREHIKFGVEVREVRRADDWKNSGKWQIRWQDTGKDGKDVLVQEEQFDAVLLCSGIRQRGWRPPEWRLEKQFKGHILHAEQLKDPSKFANKMVCVVGLGNSAVCIAAELAHSAKRVILSTRRGGWLLRPLCPDGHPWDRHFHTRWHSACRQWVPKHVRSKLWEWTASTEMLTTVNPDMNQQRPAHLLLSTHLTFDVGNLGDAIANGRVCLKPDVWSLSAGNLVEFVDGSVADGVDALILCTGYQFDFRLVENGTLLAVRHNDFHLYKHMFAPELAPHHNLAVIGHVQPIGGCIWPIAELQARLFFHLLMGKHQLPSPFWMKAELEKRRCAVSVNFLKTRRHTQMEDHVQFCLELAALVGASNQISSLFHLFRADPRLAIALWFGPLCSAQFRLWPSSNGTTRVEGDDADADVRQMVLDAGKQTALLVWPPHWRCLIGGAEWTYWLVCMAIALVAILIFRWLI